MAAIICVHITGEFDMEAIICENVHNFILIILSVLHKN